ncbi:MAG: acetate--CoA ligase family protein [Candidatus Micrarchaeales archaeon]|jgi:acyl-CoA synthetase (NDP forming)
MPMFDYIQGKKLLERYGIKSIDSRYVSSVEEAVKFAGKDKIVLKLISDKAIHKSKAGLVKLELVEQNEIASAYNDLIRKGKVLKPYKILAQKMAKSGVEIIIGGSTDKQFGKILLVGLGGIYVETFKDVQLGLCPITRNDALYMISELKSKNIITYNGEAEKQVVDLLLKVSKLLVEKKNISELDLNPVILRKDSYDVVDIRMIEG